MAGLKNAPAAASGWTDTQVVRLPLHSTLPSSTNKPPQLAYLLSVIECSKTKLDFNVSSAPIPHNPQIH